MTDEGSGICEIANFTEEILGSNGAILLDVYSPACGPCVQLAKIMDQAISEAGSVKFMKLDATKNMQLASALDIRAFPTLMLFENGQRVRTHVGAFTNKKSLLDWLKYQG